MNNSFDVEFVAENSSFQAEFSGVQVIGDGGTIIVDDKMSDTSRNPVENRVTKAYVDNNTIVSKYYSLDMATFKNYNVLAFAINKTDNTKIGVSISMALMVAENGIAQPFTDIPFEFLVGALRCCVMNEDDFKSIGITSPLLEQFGVSGYLSFEELGQLLYSGVIEEYNVTTEYVGDEVYVVLNIGLSMRTEYSNITDYYVDVVNTIFNSPDTKLVFLYQKQENIETQEATYQLDAPIIPMGE